MVQLTSSAGVIMWQYDYNCFGNEREIAGQDAELDTNPWRYCGEYFDKETGIIYLRARYYNPVIGRFTQQDSWAFADPLDPLSLNLYIYCGNNPILFIDPSGYTFMDSMQGIYDALDEDLTGGFLGWIIAKIVGYDKDYRYESEYDYYLGRTMGDTLSGIYGHIVTTSGRAQIISSIVAGGAISVGSGGLLTAGGVAVSVAGAAAGTATVTYGGTVLSFSGENFGNDYDRVQELGKTEFKKPKSGTGSEKSTDIPSWARNHPQGRPYKAENGKQFANRMMNEQYGKGNWENNSRRLAEYCKLKKYGDRGFI